MMLQLQRGHYAPCSVSSAYYSLRSFRRPPPAGIATVSCSTSSTKPTTNTDHLRSQLHQLRSEADSARADANSARLRFMRLSEAAENLKRQAAVCVQSRREDEARELLFQKKKVMQAIEKSKSRIEVLDELCSKLNQAISSKESQLIGNLGSDLDVDAEEDAASGPVRVVSPKGEEFPNDSDSTNKDFLEQTDKQLSKIEAQLLTVLNDEEKPDDNLKVKQTKALLISIRGIRQQVAEMMECKVES
ncbi:hypothetical protein LINGRAHAP2_LOCUS19060 [Linum grandiflorum]